MRLLKKETGRGIGSPPVSFFKALLPTVGKQTQASKFLFQPKLLEVWLLSLAVKTPNTHCAVLFPSV